MASNGIAALLLQLLLMLTLVNCKKVRIPDNLDDVVDSEEDEVWKAWGKQRSSSSNDFDPPPDFSNMSPEQIQREMLKRHIGTSIGFVKLRLEDTHRRSKEDVALLAKKWTQLLRTGGMDARLTAVDLNTLMFTLSRGQDVSEVKDFILTQPEAYEFKLGQQAYRRPGDPPLEVVIEKLQQQQQQHKDEL